MARQLKAVQIVNMYAYLSFKTFSKFYYLPNY